MILSRFANNIDNVYFSLDLIFIRNQIRESNIYTFQISYFYFFLVIRKLYNILMYLRL